MLRLASILITTVLLVSACAVGPQFHRPSVPKVNRYTAEPMVKKTVSANTPGGKAQDFINNLDIPRQWWTVFKSPSLNSLIKQSLAHNPDLQAAMAALRSAQENVKAQVGYYYPTVDANAIANRQSIAKSVPGESPLSSGALLFTLYTPQVTVSYAPDVFGLNRRTVESLQAQADAQSFQLVAAYLTISSNVVAAAIQEASLRSQIATTQKMIGINRKMLKTLRSQFSLGYVMKADVAAQALQLAQIEASLPPLQRQLAQQRDLLTTLAGRFTSNEVSEKFELAQLHLPQNLPLSLPARLVQQRPDVRMAEEQVHAASAQVGIAVANRFPQFPITGNSGYTGQNLAKLINPFNFFWDVTAGVAQPIFAGGTLLHRQRSAEALYDQAVAQYRSTVLSAVQNVADTLRALQYDAIQLEKTKDFEAAAKVSWEVAREQYKLGYTNSLGLFYAENAYQQAQIALIIAEANRFSDTAALFQALGGGWLQTSNTAKATKKSC